MLNKILSESESESESEFLSAIKYISYYDVKLSSLVQSYVLITAHLRMVVQAHSNVNGHQDITLLTFCDRIN